MSNLHTPGYVPLQQVVYEFLNEIGDYSEKNFFRWLNVAARGFAKLNMTRLESYQVQYLTVDKKSFSAVLNPDFVDWIKVAVVDGNTVKVLARNKDILVNDEQNGATVDDGQFFFAPHMYNGQRITGMYGVSGGYSSPTFNIDKERGIIRFSSHIPTNIVLVEYISSGLSSTGATYIPYKAVDPLVEYLYWRHRKADPKATRGQELDSKQDYLEAVEELSFYENLPTRQDILMAFYSGSGQGAKR